MRCFLVVKVLREKHSNILGRMKSRVINLNKHAREGGMTLQQMNVRRDNLKVLDKGVATRACVQHEEVDGLKKSLEEAQSTL